MFWLEIDLEENAATLHRDDCAYGIPEETKDISMNELKEGGGWLSFESPGEAMRYYTDKRMKGKIKSCSFCKPLDHLRFKPLAKIKIESMNEETSKSNEMTVLDTKSMWKKLTRKFSDLDEKK